MLAKQIDQLETMLDQYGLHTVTDTLLRLAKQRAQERPLPQAGAWGHDAKALERVLRTFWIFQPASGVRDRAACRWLRA